MGLDMYLSKAKRVAGLTVEDYETIEHTLDSIDSMDMNQILNFPIWNEIEGARELVPTIHLYSDYLPLPTIFTQIGYWRKVNQIHAWFVDHVQDGVDECQRVEVTKHQLELLLVLVNSVLADHDKAETFLPTRSGFFFGGTDYGEYYSKDLEGTKAILEDVLSEVDFESEIVFYQSSW